MATANSTTIGDYEYMDEAKIDRELICSICMQPFQSPCSLPCQHTFCRHCIEEWLVFETSCPICRQPRSSHNDRNRTYPKRDRKPLLSPVETPIVINLLNALLVRCKYCQQSNIHRGNLRDHQSNCPKTLVPCPSVDIQCSWRGPRDQQASHMAICLFQQLRPILTSFQTELRTSNEIQKNLECKLRKQSSQITFLCAFVNKGKSMSMNCKTSPKHCGFLSASQRDSKTKKFSCVLCQKLVRYKKVSLHTCSSCRPYDCICGKCYDRYCSHKDDEGEDQNDEDQVEDEEEDSEEEDSEEEESDESD